MKFVLYAFSFVFFSLCLSGCGQIVADSLFSDQYLKPITMSRMVNFSSKKTAVNAAVDAAVKVGYTPKTISVETGYVVAEYVADPKFTRGARDYTFKLTVRLPETGKGKASITITPPSGLVSSKTMEQEASEYFDALLSLKKAL